MKEKVQRFGAVLVNSFLFLVSAYVVWGWITVSDIRTKCERKGYDFDSVMSSLITSPFELQAITNALAGGTNYVVIANNFPEFGRFALTFLHWDNESRTMTSTNATNGITRETVSSSGASMGGLIEPFAFMSENFVNLIFCMGIGYMMSSTLLLLKLLKNTPLSIRYMVLRPVAGSLVGGCLFILVLSGGALFWTNTSHVSGLSIGVLAAFGAVYCERFERVLKKGFSQNAKSND